jgi:hypothetical protein
VAAHITPSELRSPSRLGLGLAKPGSLTPSDANGPTAMDCSYTALPVYELVGGAGSRPESPAGGRGRSGKPGSLLRPQPMAL